MTIESLTINYLNNNLPNGVRASGSAPHPMPDAFVTVEQTGGSDADHIKGATLAIQSWAATRAAAAELNETVKAIMAQAAELPQISRCALSTDYNYTDLATNHPRYQAVYDIIFYL